MKGQSRFLLTTIACCIALTFSPASSAEDTDFLPRLGENTEFYMRHAACHACAYAASNYNDKVSQIRSVEEALDEVADDIEDDLENIDVVNAKIENYKAEMQSAKGAGLASLERALAAAEGRRNTYTKELADDRADLQEGEDYYDELTDSADYLLTQLNACEDTKCGKRGEPIKPVNVMDYSRRLELGVLIGNMSSSRSTDYFTPFDEANGSHSQNLFEMGLQGKYLFGTPENYRPFIYGNVDTTFNRSNQLFEMRSYYGSDDHKTTLNLYTNWIGRVGVGVDSKPFLNDHFTVSGGIGIAALNQTVNANVFVGDNWRFSSSQTSIAPTIMASLNYYVCPTCVYGHPFIISAQITADNYRSVNVADKFEGTDLRYGFNTDSTWQAHEALVFSTRF